MSPSATFVTPASPTNGNGKHYANGKHENGRKNGNGVAKNGKEAHLSSAEVIRLEHEHGAHK